MTSDAGVRRDLQHLRELLDHNSDWAWEVDAQGRYTYCSRMVTALLGHPPEAMLGRTPFDFMPPAEAVRVGETFAAIVAERRAFSGLVNRNLHADGRIVVLETSGVPLFDSAGALRGYRGIDRDISELGERVLQLEAVYDHAAVPMSTVDATGTLVMGNRAMAALCGHDGPVAGLRLVDLLPDAAQWLDADLARARDGQPLPTHEFAWRSRWLYAAPHALHDALGRVAGLSIAWMDITARRQAEQLLTQANRRLEGYARQDYVTGLYNRRDLDERLALEIGRARRDGSALSLCMADVDYFKAYNDGVGHLAGDDCLRMIAGALRRAVSRPGDAVSRYGGEEFVVVLAGTDEAGAAHVAERVRSRVEALDLAHPASPLGRVTVSIGVVTCRPQREPLAEDDAAAVAALLRLADHALYAAKHAGRNRVATEPLPTTLPV
ncbi:diguanylate cyclase [Luteimonas sp. TWI1416]|uniref:sensor domain-containing diguanylate cyclase n=1 Tax=unclassified Luteimonas TaxID=2629088 RepID=UPI003209D51A